MKKLLAGAIALLLCLTPFPAYAMEVTLGTAEDAGYDDSDPWDYITERFDVTADVASDHVVHVTERIVVNFVQMHHGITRDIPLAKDNTYELKNVKVSGWTYKTSEDNSYLTVRIGDADKYLTGQQEYTLTYDIAYYRDDDDLNDYLAQNLLPTGWETSIRESVLTLTMPQSLDWNGMAIYAGRYGENDGDWDAYFSYTTDGNTMTITGRNIPKNYGLTVRDVSLPEGYYTNVPSYEEAHLWIRILILLGGAAAALASLLLWIRFGRDLPVVETVEFYPPEDLTPAEIGFMIDGSVEDEELMAMFLYYADRGYMKIEETSKNCFAFVKERDIDPNEPRFASILFNGMFAGKERVHTNLVPESFRGKMDLARDAMTGSYKARYGSVFATSSWIARAVGVVLSLLLPMWYGVLVDELPVGIILMLVFGGWEIMTGLTLMCVGFERRESGKGRGFRIAGILLGVIGGLLSLWVLSTELPLWIGLLYLLEETVIFATTVVMLRRDERSAAMLGRVRGFRSFIKLAEYDRLAALSGEDPTYFYRILPYASVLGLDTVWANKFTKINVPQPTWYDTYDQTPFVYSPHWCRQITHTAVREAMPPMPQSDSSGGSYSGGFSGGGFSGGGGGGGGGGAW